jgi:hypothetical protein
VYYCGFAIRNFDERTDHQGRPPGVVRAYVFNATAQLPGRLGYLTPDGEQQPVVSTLNAIDGNITSNMAIVLTTNSKIDATNKSRGRLRRWPG